MQPTNTEVINPATGKTVQSYKLLTEQELPPKFREMNAAWEGWKTLGIFL